MTVQTTETWIGLKYIYKLTVQSESFKKRKVSHVINNEGSVKVGLTNA